jgi:RNA polymerase sigma-70 factor (ECF subfamily)
VKQLPEKWQIILRMRSEQHMETEDIARALGTSAGAVRGMLSKARARLLTLINQQYEIRRNQH